MDLKVRHHGNDTTAEVNVVGELRADAEVNAARLSYFCNGLAGEVEADGGFKTAKIRYICNDITGEVTAESQILVTAEVKKGGAGDDVLLKEEGGEDQEITSDTDDRMAREISVMDLKVMSGENLAVEEDKSKDQVEVIDIPTPAGIISTVSAGPRAKTPSVKPVVSTPEVIVLEDDDDTTPVAPVKETMSTDDKKSIERLKKTLTRKDTKISTLEETVEDLQEANEEFKQTVKDLQDGTNLGKKLVTLRAQNKKALEEGKKAAVRSIEKVKKDRDAKLVSWKAKYEEAIAGKEAKVEKSRIELDKQKQRVKDAWAAAKAAQEAASEEEVEARETKKQNNAELADLKKLLKEQHADEMERLKPEKTRKVVEKEDEIKDLKIQVKELQKAETKANNDIEILRRSIKEEVQAKIEVRTDKDLHRSKYLKYKQMASRQLNELNQLKATHTKDKADSIEKAEAKQFEMQQKWSVQWNLAQDKRSEVMSLTRAVSELRNGNLRKDKVITDLEAKLRNSSGVLTRLQDLSSSATQTDLIGIDAHSNKRSAVGGAESESKRAKRTEG